MYTGEGRCKGETGLMVALFVTPELFQIAVGADTGPIVRLLLTARVSLLFSQGLVHWGLASTSVCSQG